MNKWFAQATANVALIKYMGKSDESLNLPSNLSFSYTLDSLQSFVEIEKALSHHPDRVEPLELPGSHPFVFSEASEQRFLAHMAFLKRHFNYEGSFIVRSCNNFPMAAGLASSASSFAALTKAAVRALCELTKTDEPDVTSMALLSQRGSGSSCRSFFKPWALWNTKTVKAVDDIPYQTLLHSAIVVSHAPKSVLSSEAHRRVQTSPHFKARITNAETRYHALHDALLQKNWHKCYNLAREDFLEMHQLFETAQQPFRYITEQTERVLEDIARYWQNNNDGPLVTMDAGPNIHLLFRPDQSEMAAVMKEKFLKDYDVI